MKKCGMTLEYNGKWVPVEDLTKAQYESIVHPNGKLAEINKLKKILKNSDYLSGSNVVEELFKEI
jgi:hypothetical protein